MQQIVSITINPYVNIIGNEGGRRKEILLKQVNMPKARSTTGEPYRSCLCTPSQDRSRSWSLHCLSRVPFTSATQSSSSGGTSLIFRLERAEPFVVWPVQGCCGPSRRAGGAPCTSLPPCFPLTVRLRHPNQHCNP